MADESLIDAFDDRSSTQKVADALGVPKSVAKDLAKAARKTSDDDDDDTKPLSEYIETGWGYLAALIVTAAYVWSTGGLFGLTKIQSAAAAAVLFTLLYIVWTSESELSLPFMLSLIALLSVGYELLPPGIQRLIPAETAVVALNLDGVFRSSPFDVVQFAGIAITAMFVYWVVTIRAGSGAKNADTVAAAIFGSGTGERKGKLTQLVEKYITIWRLLFTFAIAVGFVFAAQITEIVGILGGILGDAPMLVANLATGLVGWLSLGGELNALAGVPVVGPTLQRALNSIQADPATFALFVAVSVAIAIAVDYNS